MKSGFEALECLSAVSAALFLDFDGTLADIVDRPESVHFEAATLKNLSRLFRNLDGALAIVTGRDLATIDQFLAPHVFPVSGVHGFEMRSKEGEVHRLTADSEALTRMEQVLSAFAQQHDGLLLEKKPASVALHYRGRPELFELCRQSVSQAHGEADNLRVLRGKMVIEVKAHGGDKGKAIATFMGTVPFRSRQPIFIGDDVTDEAAFEEVNARNGISIKVGDGETVARYRLADPDAVRAWLRHLADQL